MIAGLVVGGAGGAASADPLPAPPGGDVRFDWDAARAQMRSRQAASRLPGTALGGATRGGSVTTRIAGTSRSVVQSFETGTASVTTTAAGTASKFGTLARGAGNVLMAAFALDMTYSAFTGDGGFGYGGLIGYDSNGLLCDLTNIVGSNAGCSPGPASEYVLNSDITDVSPPGYNPAGVRLYADAGTYCTGASCGQVVGDFVVQIDVEVPTVPAFGSPFVAGAPGFSYVFSWELQAASDFYRTPGGVSGQLVAMWRDVQTGVFMSSGSDSFTVGSTRSGSQVETLGTYGLPINRVSLVFDHLAFITEAYPVVTYPVVLQRGTATESPGWYPEGHSDWTPGTEADPVRWWTTTWLCEGGSPQSAQSATWHETDAEWPVPVDPSCDGSALVSVTVTEEGTGLDPWVLYEWTLPVELSAWAQAYPECTGGACLLELHYVDPASGTRLACFDSPELCLGWFEAPLKADTYVCTYGTHDVALAECNMYAPTFDPARWPVSGAAPYGDPETGESAPGAPVVVPAPDNGCPPPFTWTSLVTPWWYYKGVTCALTWAFVPSQTTIGRLEGFRSEVSGRAPVSYMVTGVEWIDAAADGLSSDGSCADGPFEMGGNDLPSFNLCEAAVSARQTTWGTVLWNMIAAALVGSGLFVAWRRISASFGGK